MTATYGWKLMCADVQKNNELPWLYRKDGNNSYLKLNSNGKI